ncbi:MAG: MBL fold metallo-hydrolase [Alphaproteobacteria bacterium]|nr:MBL fold metallo-hydrolase [Alphaproteobacteria bacterium]
MDVTFWGVRGSIPIPGTETTRWGGNSSCVEVRHGDLPPLVLDCGTGARALGQKLAREHTRRVHLLFSHLHADHIFGLPFFLPLYAPGAHIDVGVPAYLDEEARERIGRYLNGTFHPTRLRDVPAELGIFAVRAGSRVPLDGWEVTSVRLNHPGGSVGYRVTAGHRTFAYITDTAPFAQPGQGVAAGEPPTPAEKRIIAFLEGCRVVVYDTMYDKEEYLEKMTWGHSYPEYAVALCREAGVEQLVLFHHLPEAADDDLDARAARFASSTAPRVVLAREGDTLEV